MKVLHLINQLTVGGAEKLILDAIPLYNNYNIQADVIVHKSTGEDLFLNQLKAKDCCNIIDLSFTSVYDPRVIIKLKPFLAKYDIIHAHLFPGFYFLALARTLFKSKAKLIYTEHNTTNRRMEKWWLKPLDYFVYKKYDKIVAISDEIASLLKTYIPLKKKDISVIENGINLKLARLGKPTSVVPQNKKIITQIAAFRPQKDHFTLIKSLLHLPDEVQLLMAGEGETKKACFELVSKLKLKERVLFLGNRSDISDIMASSDILVLSSHYEGLSLSSIEAMASGKPFLASRVPGLQKLVEGYGVLFEPGNDEELSSKILELLYNKTKYNAVRKKCMDRSKKYDIKIMTKKYLNLYREILN